MAERTVLDEATEALERHTEPYEGICLVPGEAAELVLRVAADRLRDVAITEITGSRSQYLAGMWDAADMLTEGIDRG